MNWYEHIIWAHLQVTDNVRHAEYMESDRYFVWAEDGRNDLKANDRHTEKAVTGTTDLFTTQEFDPWIEELEAAFDESPYIVWAYNSAQYEEETGLFHHEWVWEVV